VGPTSQSDSWIVLVVAWPPSPAHHSGRLLASATRRAISSSTSPAPPGIAAGTPWAAPGQHPIDLPLSTLTHTEALPRQLPPRAPAPALAVPVPRPFRSRSPEAASSRSLPRAAVGSVSVTGMREARLGGDFASLSACLCLGLKQRARRLIVC